MGRYGIFKGTNKDGLYTTIGFTDGILNFLSAQGATNATHTLDIICNISGGFTEIPGYLDQPANDYPVAFRYVPMHLSKRSDMPNAIQPMYVVSISGAENKSRNTNYSCTAIMDRDEVLGSSRANYLEQILGTPLVTDRMMSDIREKNEAADFSLSPKPLCPVMKPGDRKAVLAAVNAIYEDKKVLIKLERGCSFNLRSVELLRQIYSMMQPRLATEVGFASYQAPNFIYDLVQEAGIRIFVLPYGVDAGYLSNDFLVLDMNDADHIAVDEKSDMIKCLKSWYGLSWEKRLEAMTKLFDLPGAGFKDAEKFVEISKELFSGDFAKWCRLGSNIPEAGTITSLQALYDKYNSFPVLEKNVSWLHDMFRQKVNVMLPKSVNLNLLVLELNSEIMLSAEKNPRKEALLDFGISLMKPAAVKQLPEAAGKKACRKQEEITREECDRSIQAERENWKVTEEKLHGEIHERKQEIIQLNTEHSRQVEELKSEHILAIAAAAAAHEKQCAEIRTQITADYEEKLSGAEKQIEEEKLARQREVQTLNEEHGRQVEELKNSFDQEKTAAEAAFQKKYSDLRSSAEQEIFRLKEEQKRELDTRQQELEQTREKVTLAEREKAQSQQENAALKERVDQLISRVDDLNSRGQDLAARNRDLEAKKSSLETELSGLKEREQALTTSAKALQREKEQLQNEVDSLSSGEEVKKLKRELQKMNTTLETQQDKGKKAKIIFAAAGFLAALLICGVIFLVNALMNPDDRSGPEVSPPIETAEPAETNELITDEQPEAVPSEEPEETPELPAAFNADEIDWEKVQEDIPEISAVETDTETIKMLTAGCNSPEGFTPVAVLTVEENGFDAFSETESFPMAVILKPDSEENETQTESAVLPEAEETGAAAEGLTVQNDELCMLVFGGEEMQQAALNAFRLVSEDEAVMQFTISSGEQPFGDISGLQIKLFNDTKWLSQVQYVSLNSDELEAARLQLETEYAPAAAIYCDDGVEYVFYLPDNQVFLETYGVVEKSENTVAFESDFIAVYCRQDVDAG